MIKKKILDGHIKQGHDYIPKIKNDLNLQEVEYINDIIPEIIWIAFFIEKYGVQDGSRLVLDFLNICNEIKPLNNSVQFYFISVLNAISEPNWKKITSKLEDVGKFEIFSNALQDFINLYYDDNPFARFKNNDTFDKENGILKAKQIISNMFNRRSEFAMIIQAIICIADIENNNSHYPRDIEIPNFNIVLENCYSQAAKELHGRVRNHVNSSFMIIQKNISFDWSKYFWNNGNIIEDVQSPIAIENLDSYTSHPILVFSKQFTSHCHQIINSIWTKLPIEIYNSNQFEVIGAIISRQTALASKLSLNPAMWDFHIAPIILRTMIDCHITLSWILQSPDERSKLYISYGLGQEKLYIEHLRSLLDEITEEDELGDLNNMINIKEQWINSQHYTFLQDVRIGSWSGISTRKMAEEAGILSTYNSLFTPWSFATHNMWNHTAIFNLKSSSNPLHKFMKVPSINKSSFEYDQMYNASKYLSKSMKLIIDTYELKVDDDLPEEWFIKNIDTLIHGLNDSIN
ncbi:MAG: hypothetical protein KA015_04730 [Spirochaetes bacterium]|nr:hypothetical protein [Spirochaetota bacterium]